MTAVGDKESFTYTARATQTGGTKKFDLSGSLKTLNPESTSLESKAASIIYGSADDLTLSSSIMK